MDDRILDTLTHEPARRIPGGGGAAGAPGSGPLTDLSHPGRELADWIENIAGAGLLFLILFGVLFIGECLS